MYRFARLFHNAIGGKSIAVPMHRSPLSFQGAGRWTDPLGCSSCSGASTLSSKRGWMVSPAMPSPITRRFSPSLPSPSNVRRGTETFRRSSAVLSASFSTRPDGATKRRSRRSAPQLFLVGAGPADRKPVAMSGSIIRRYVPTRSRRKYRPTVLGFLVNSRQLREYCSDRRAHRVPRPCPDRLPGRARPLPGAEPVGRFRGPLPLRLSDR